MPAGEGGDAHEAAVQAQVGALDASAAEALGGLAQAVGVGLGLDAREVGAEDAVEPGGEAGAGGRGQGGFGDGEGGEGGVEEEAGAPFEAALAEHGRHERELVVVHPADLAAGGEGGPGEGAVDALVGGPGRLRGGLGGGVVGELEGQVDAHEVEEGPEEAVGHLRVVTAPVVLREVEALVADGAHRRLEQLEAGGVGPGAVVGAATGADPGGSGGAVPGDEHGPDGLDEPARGGRGTARAPGRGVVIDERAVRQYQVHPKSVGEAGGRGCERCRIVNSDW